MYTISDLLSRLDYIYSIKYEILYKSAAPTVWTVLDAI